MCESHKCDGVRMLRESQIEILISTLTLLENVNVCKMFFGCPLCTTRGRLTFVDIDPDLKFLSERRKVFNIHFIFNILILTLFNIPNCWISNT